MNKVSLTAFVEDRSRTWELHPYIQDGVIVLDGPCSYDLQSVADHFPAEGKLRIDIGGRNFGVHETVFVELSEFHQVVASIRVAP